MPAKKKILTGAQRQELLKVDLGVRNNTIIRTLIYTGLRASELVRLVITDIYFGNQVRQELTFISRPGPSVRNRIIPLYQDLRISLMEYRAWLVVKESLNISCVSYPVFTTGPWCKKQLTARQVQRIIREFGAKAGIPGVTVQVLRNTFKHNVSKAYGLPAAKAALGVKS